MKLTATDTIHITQLGAEPILAGQAFDIDADTARDLIDRGLATAVVEKAKPAPVKKR